MVRFSVSLDEEQNEWVEQRAEELNGSKSQIVGMVIDAARRNEIQLGPNLERGGTEEAEGIEQRFDSLESRVAELEAALDDDSEPPNSASGGSEVADTNPTETVEAVKKGDEEGTQPASSKEGATDLRDDPEVNAVRTFIAREANGQASEDEITACWEFLKQRGTASPKAFKNQFAPESCATEEDVETWWQDGVKPVFQQLPGVEAPDDGGRFYRYKY